MKYAALVPCGPGPLEVMRAVDLLEALAFHDPEDCLAVLLLNDGNPDIAARVAGFPRVCVVDHPRQGKGWGWGGGLIGGELWAFEWLMREFPGAGCVIKLDTDALIIKPLGEALGRIFSDPTVGIAGSRIGLEPLPAYKTTNPLGYFATKARKLCAPVSLWRKPRWHLRFTLGGPHRWVASLFHEARSRGYLRGELIEGGALAFGREAVGALVEKGVTARWRDFLDAPVSDDVILTMLAYYAGSRAVDAPLFCIEPATLRQAPAVLMADPCVGVVHSLKAFEGTDEPALRKAFRQGRVKS